MPLTYVIADLHGRFDLLELAFDAVARRHAPATLICLGDYVDRGPQSRQIIERLMAGAQIAGLELVCLKGNHEEIMRLTCRELPHPGWWLQNGGGQTLLSYGHSHQGDIDLSVVPAAHLEWIANLPLMHVDTHRVYVHAWIDAGIPLDQQDPKRMTWTLYSEWDEGGHGDRHVVHGHHQFEKGPIRKSGRTDLDTFAWYTGRLVVGVFDDDIAGGPIELLEILGKPAAARAA